MIGTIIAVAVALFVGGIAGYAVFRYVINGKYNQLIESAKRDADVIKEKKLLEVKEKFLNKKSELEKEVQQRNQKIQQGENRLKQREISLNQRQEELGRRKEEVEQEQVRIENEKKLSKIAEILNLTERSVRYKIDEINEEIGSKKIEIKKS